MKSRRLNSHAFTLIELLTVIAILAILSALVLGGIHTAKERAKNTVCKNNLRQLGSLLSSFVSDHHEYPLFINHDTNKYAAHQPTWGRTIGAAAGLDPKGIGAAQTFVCPSVRVVRGVDYGYNASGIVGKAGQEGLGLGGKGGENPGNAFAPPVKEGEVAVAAGMIAIGDSIEASPSGTLSDNAARIGIYYWVTEHVPGSYKRSMARHKGKANFGFCDGHVSEMNLERLLVRVDEEHARLWNRDNKAHLDRIGR